MMQQCINPSLSHTLGESSRLGRSAPEHGFWAFRSLPGQIKRYNSFLLLFNFASSWQGHRNSMSQLLRARPNPTTSRPDHNTGNSVPYSLRIVCGFFNVPHQYRETVYRPRITKAALSPQLFKECWSGRDLNLRPPAQQSGALPTELTGRR